MIRIFNLLFVFSYLLIVKLEYIEVEFLILNKPIKNLFSKLLLFKSNSNLILLLNFFIVIFLFDVSKAETKNSAPQNNDEIKIEYLESKKNLEDYIIDTGDALFIEFENKPRGLNSYSNEDNYLLNPKEVSYLDPKNNLDNYILDEGDVLNIKFKNIPQGDPEILKKDIDRKSLDIEYLNPTTSLENYFLDEGDSVAIRFLKTPELNRIATLDRQGEVFLPRIKGTYVRGLSISELSKLLESRYQEFLIEPEIEVSIAGFRSIKSGNYRINRLGEIKLPRAKNLYVKGLKIQELERLLEKKFLEFGIFFDVEIEINQFKFISSGIYQVDIEGEIFLPKIKETYVRGLTPKELSNLLQKKYSDLNINAKTDIRIARFKKLRVLVSGEIRSPGVYSFPAYTVGDFKSVSDIKDEIKKDENLNSSIEIGNKEIKNKQLTEEKVVLSEAQKSTNNSGSIVDYSDNSLDNSTFENKIQNNNSKTNFEIKRPSEKITTISNAIRAAGGITSQTDLSRIEIIRDIPIGKGGGQKRTYIDFSSFLNESDPSNDIRLFDGDRLFFSTLDRKVKDQIPKSILSGLSPRFISVNLFGRVENPGVIKLPLEASLSDAIDLSGPIKPLSGKIVLIRYNKDGTIIKKNISYSARAKRGSKRNPYLEANDLISVKNSFLGKSTGLIREITAPFVGIYTTKEIIESFD